MARYFFDICDDFLATSDEAGEEWASREDAGRRARQILAEIAAESPFEQPECRLVAKVRNETGRIVCVATLTLGSKSLDAASEVEQQSAVTWETSASMQIAASGVAIISRSLGKVAVDAA